ncbi:GntR family transcriptional regulator [Oceanobacillus sp. 143]|uniref:FadR family transcriptional regulator n=1 Tax=Oceanobacillus zhaokaii TaxID=2052660 RepID=A0A345PI43_9BACI|nr:GntR family transcriptional regulator [Oceanobacillus zhaokaii]AXI09673.1 FadR family transcriptional regulator [Oceanobacillus zhaokaii]QGS69007.1 GntR family transcriptional regulator [Oceanobacillus sp. 143]
MSLLPNQKVYQGVLNEIRSFIEKNKLNPGDKLPSERELSEKLQAGRSSIREALRALELLGLIETKAGEGTYLSTYRSFQTVELLSSFILQESNTREDLFLSKRIIEKEAAKLAFDRFTDSDFVEINRIIDLTYNHPNDRHVAFFNFIFMKTENLLLTRIWQLMEEFSHTIKKDAYNPSFYRKLVELYTERHYAAIENLFNKLESL